MKGSIAIGAILGTAFYVFGEASVPTSANCSYLASPWTDAAASIAGIALLVDAHKTQSAIEACVGGAVVAIHSWQWIMHKGILKLRADR